MRCRESGERAEWWADAWDASAAELGAALGCSVAMGHSYLRYAMAMRERLPRVGEVFRAGGIDYRSFQTIVFRTDLIDNAQALARVDAQVAAMVSRRPSLSRGGLSAAVDRVVAFVDADAVRRAQQAASDRYVDVLDNESGMAYLSGSLLAAHGRALDRRLDELAATVCEADPRTATQRRADAVGPLVAGDGRLVCGCGRAECAAGAPARTSNVIIHMVAERASVEGRGSAPAVLPGVEGLIPAEVLAELATSARLVPLDMPTGAEPRYRPSTSLADFVRCRDLTCRAPGCDRPATECDLDHTIPYADGGPTHASNLKSLCRIHHLMKTFWGWRDKQLPDGTVIWTLPDGHTYVTTPGSALLFPSLCAPTGDIDPPAAPRPQPCGDREAMMPRRTRTRAQNRAHRVATERSHNRRMRLAAEVTHAEPPAEGDGEPPPF